MYNLSLCLDDLNKLSVNVGKNGKKYVNVSLFLNEEPDQFNNIIQLKGKVNESFIFVGNGKKHVKKQVNEDNDLPF